VTQLVFLNIDILISREEEMAIKLGVLIMLLALVFFGGCATTIQLNGGDVPTEQMGLTNLETGITAVCQLVQFVEESEDSVSYRYPKLSETDQLSADTKAVEFQIRVVNPGKKRYRLEKQIFVGEEALAKEIYDGNAPDKTFQIPGPLEPAGKVIAIRAVVRSANGAELMAIGDGTYIVKPRKQAAVLLEKLDK
jgi:hypothetical protein